ncbi:MAG: TlpA family protein disulfide reductase [Roseivirga sp.]|nr:TlpA family protein disulfide reductase [Roseivirga sp.]
MKKLFLAAFILFSYGLYAQKPAESIQGNWFKTDGSNTWAIGLHEKYAVYDAQFWDYGEMSQSDELYKIELKQPNARRVIKINEITGGLYIRDGKTSMRVEAKRQSEDRLRLKNGKSFGSDFISPDQVELMGILQHKEKMALTASVIYNDPFSEAQQKYTVNVDDQGRFKLNFPLKSPQTVMLTVGETFLVYLAEPGAKQAMWIDEESFMGDGSSWTSTKELLFMGDLAQENEEYRIYKPQYMEVRGYFENDSIQKASEPMEYLAYRIGLMEKHNAFNEAYFEAIPTSRKVRELAKREARLYAADDLMRYRWMKNMRTTREVVDLPQPYLEKVRALISNDPVDLLSTEYGSVMREMTMGMMPSARERAHEIRMARVYEFLKSKALSESNRVLVDHWLSTEKAREEHFGIVKFPEKVKPFTDQYKAEIKDLNSVISFELMLERISGLGKLAHSSVVNTFIDQVYFSKGTDVPDAVWEKAMSLDMIPLAKEVLKTRKSDLAILRNSKFVEGVAISDSEDDILAQLKNKYKGKVVYIDVWATWCAPCIGEFSYMPDVKENLKDQKDVVFVYLCAQSKEESWKTMVKKHKLKGDNLYLDDNKYAMFDKTVNVTGFPTYLVITKEGKLVREGIKRPSRSDELIDQLKEFAGRK